MGNIFDYVDIFTGKKSNALNLNDTKNKILGIVMSLMAFGIAQKIYVKADNWLSMVDAGIDPVVRKQTVSSGPQVTVY